MRTSLLAACSVLLGGCLDFPEEGAYRCGGAPAAGCSDQCFCPDTAPPSVNDQINFIFGARNGQEIWVVGLYGQLWRRKDGQWTTAGNLGQKLYGGWGRDPVRLNVVGEAGELLEA